MAVLQEFKIKDNSVVVHELKLPKNLTYRVFYEVV